MDGVTTHWLIDLLDGEVVVQPCCSSLADCLDSYGYTATVGRTLQGVVAELSA